GIRVKHASEEAPVAIKIVTICGSVRPGNYTSMALRLALDEFAKTPGVEVTPIQLDTLDLPLPGLPPKNPAAVEWFQQTVKAATGILLASPEYHGGITSPLKLAIHHHGFPDMVAGKPRSFVGAAAVGLRGIKFPQQPPSS